MKNKMNKKGFVWLIPVIVGAVSLFLPTVIDKVTSKPVATTTFSTVYYGIPVWGWIAVGFLLLLILTGGKKR